MSVYTLYIFLALIALLIVFAMFLLIKQREFFYEKIFTLQEAITEQKSQNEQFYKNLELVQMRLNQETSDSFTDKIYYLNKNLNDQLLNSQNSFKNEMTSIDEIFRSLLEKVAKIELQGEISKDLKSEINKFNQIMTNQKLRGNFGEFQLFSVLEAVFGQNSNFYELQKTLPNSYVCDCALKLNAERILCVDSKFLLSSYNKICTATQSELKALNSQLFTDIKREILSISQKYIINGITAEYAVMFIPSEAVFGYVLSNLTGVYEFACSNRVFIASPTTLMALFNSIKLIKRDEDISKNANLMREKILILGEKFASYHAQSQTLIKHLDKTNAISANFIKNSAKLCDEFSEIKNLKF